MVVEAVGLLEHTQGRLDSVKGQPQRAEVPRRHCCSSDYWHNSWQWRQVLARWGSVGMWDPAWYVSTSFAVTVAIAIVTLLLGL